MRNIIKLALAGLLSVSTFAVAAESSPEALRIGYQKGSIGMVLAKSHQLLEKRYPESKISWVEFPAGPQMLEALNVGSIDLGSTGDIPPIFAQAAAVFHHRIAVANTANFRQLMRDIDDGRTLFTQLIHDQKQIVHLFIGE